VCPAALETLPAWLVQGLLIGVGLSFVVCGLFYVLVKRFPDRPREREARTASEARRRAEIRTYLDSIDEAYTEDQAVAGHQVAFSLPARDVAITFDARAYYGLAPTGTVPVLVEHELPGLALGNRLPFDTPDLGDQPDATGASDPHAAAYAALGLHSDAPIDEVTRAYRQRVKEVHPDHGGDEAEFKRLREAYTMAKRHAE